MQLNLGVVYCVFKGYCACSQVLGLFFAAEVLVVGSVLTLARVFKRDFQNILVDVKGRILTLFFHLKRRATVVHNDIHRKL
jgi:hypothetical protein